MKIVYYNNCWFTNVGEAFIDIGALYIIDQLWNKPQVACVSDMSDWYASSLASREQSKFKRRTFSNTSAKIYNYLEADYFVMSGMFASERYLDSSGRKMVDQMIQNGSKLVILGLGSEKYTEDERTCLARYYEKLKPELIITRDVKTYMAYKDCAETILGLDCAFWVKNTFDPRGFANNRYNVHTFNRSEEPKDIPIEDADVIRAWHMQYYTSLSNLKDNYMVSDSPYDYLTMYANANKVYTDLVHATIPALQYGVPVKYYFFDDRSNAFEVVENLKRDEDGFLSVEEEKLEIQKNGIINSIREKV